MCVVAISNSDSIGLIYESISRIKDRYCGEQIIFVVQGLRGLFDVEGVEFVDCKFDLAEKSPVALLTLLGTRSFDRVVLVGFARNQKLPVSIISTLMSQNLESIQQIIGEKIVRFNPFGGEKAKTLLVFPGSVYPLNMGSHQRAFNLLAALNYAGEYADVLITAGDPSHLKRSARLLESIAPHVYTYKNNKRKLPLILRQRRAIEKGYRKLRMGVANAPELFVDRLANKATFSLKKTLHRIALENDYKNIIISYAWMSDAKSLFSRDERARFRWICDTHDVQYIRNATADKNNARILSLPALNKSAEKRALAHYDDLLAISDSDYSVLEREFGSKVLKVSSAFDYAYRPVRPKSEFQPLMFGFIGGKMDANVKAVTYLLEKWWPQIHQYSPESKLFLAGSIGAVDSIKELAGFDESINIMGFVDSLDDYYRKIDISLNPVLVQGGLNFKSVEAVSYGKLLITNRLGSECLGDSNIATVVDDESLIGDILRDIELSSESFASLRAVRQKHALDYFGESKAYQELVGRLRA